MLTVKQGIANTKKRFASPRRFGETTQRPQRRHRRQRRHRVLPRQPCRVAVACTRPVTVDIKVIPELQTIIDASECGELTFLVTNFGKPFSANGFGNWFKKRCKEAGLAHCSAHGVRKAAAGRLAELGCSDHEIMAIGGWQTLKEVQRYTKGARRRVLADNAMDKVQADIDGTKVSNLSRGGRKVRQ